MSGIVVGIEDVTENKIDKLFLSLGIYIVVDGRQSKRVSVLYSTMKEIKQTALGMTYFRKKP